jgi:hypothetical protein
MNGKQILKSALHAGDWFVNTQNKDSESGDLGRFIYALKLETKEYWLSSGWQTAFGVFALLSLHNATKDDKYLQAAEGGIKYIKTLQILDQRKPCYFGAIREVSPQSEWMHPRDALSAAWGMLGYHLYTNEQDCLERAILYADWMLKYALIDDWVVATVNLGNKKTRSADDLVASCQSGSILFLIEMYKVTQDLRYYDAAYRMANYYVVNLISKDGVITCIKDRIGNNPDVNNTEKWPIDWQKMHQVNDDFGGIALVEAYRIFKKEEYRQRCSAYLGWLEKTVNKDGSYLDPVIEVGSATAPIFLLSFESIANSSEKVRARKLIEKNISYLLSIQQKSKDKLVDGAFLGMDGMCRAGHGNWINIRCTSYATIALCRLLGKSVFPLSMSGLI